jgi:uncharacterized protein with PIN domain
MFWDSSALVALLVAEPESERALAWAANDSRIVVSFISPIEITSALIRRGRDRRPDMRDQIERQLSRLESNWIVVDDYRKVVTTARIMARRHALRSGDAIQLAAALSFHVNAPETLPLVTLDR